MATDLCRKTYAPGAWHKPVVRNDATRERDFYPNPTKKQRMDYYQEQDRRPVTKPVQKMPEPKPTPTVVIEKRPVLFNAAPNNDYQPLPQRKPVQKPTRVIPQTQPKPMQPTKPVVQNQPIRPVVQSQPTMPVVQNQQTKSVVQNQSTKPVVRDQPVKKVVRNQPTKPVVQNKPTEPVVQDQPTKNVINQPTKSEKQTPQVPEKTQVATPQPVEAAPEPPEEPCPAGCARLGAAAARALREELSLVMDAVSRELPKEAPTPAERFVLKQFRTVVGDEIRNALGLNVTKRLLDVHNPFYVKLQFSGKPEPGCLQAFIAAHGLSAFKRVAAPGDTFAARLASAARFDAMAAARELPCGSAKVTVTPCYKYLVCPPKLETIYGTYTEPVKTEKEDENSPSKQKESEAETTAEVNTSAKDDDTAVKQEVNKSNKNDEEVTVKQEVVDKSTDDHKLDMKEVIKSESDNQKVDIKQEVVTDTKIEEVESHTSDKNFKAEESPVKVNITIEAVTNKIDIKASKQLIENDIPKEADKPTNKKVVAKSKEEAENISAEELLKTDDLDEKEMSDQDILALMSGGIVLDECSGSEEEK